MYKIIATEDLFMASSCFLPRTFSLDSKREWLGNILSQSCWLEEKINDAIVSFVKESSGSSSTTQSNLFSSCLYYEGLLKQEGEEQGQESLEFFTLLESAFLEKFNQFVQGKRQLNPLELGQDDPFEGFAIQYIQENPRFYGDIIHKMLVEGLIGTSGLLNISYKIDFEDNRKKQLTDLIAVMLDVYSSLKKIDGLDEHFGRLEMFSTKESLKLFLEQLMDKQIELETSQYNKRHVLENAEKAETVGEFFIEHVLSPLLKLQNLKQVQNKNHERQQQIISQLTLELEQFKEALDEHRPPVEGVPVQPDASSNIPHFDVIEEKLDRIYDLMKSQQTAPAQSSAPSPISVQIQRPETEAAQAAAAAAQAEAAAATTIQSRIRGNQARRQAAAEAAQAAEAQAAEEASLRTLVQINDEAKQKIKKIISQQIQEAEKEAEKKAARKIQAHTRELIARNKARRNEAAKTIQKHRRRMITKNRADCLREQKKAAEKEQAATTIQAPLTRNQVRGRAKNEAAPQKESLSARESQISASETNTVRIVVPHDRKAIHSRIRPAGVAPQSVSSSEAPYAIIRIGDSIMYTRSRILAYK